MNVKAITLVLTGISTLGVAVTAYLTAKCTPKANEALQQAEEEKHDELTKFEKVQVAGKEYIPAIVAGAVTVGCGIAATGVGLAGITAIGASAVGLASKYKNEIKSYQHKVNDIFGKGADVKVRQAMADDKYGTPTKDSSEETLFRIWDGEEDHYFWSTLADVRQAKFDLNEDFQINKTCTIRDFFDLLGQSDLYKAKASFGWSMDMCNDLYDLPFIIITEEEVTPNENEPDTPTYYNIVYRTEPALGYDNGMYEDWCAHKEFIDADIPVA